MAENDKGAEFAAYRARRRVTQQQVTDHMGWARGTLAMFERENDPIDISDAQWQLLREAVDESSSATKAEAVSEAAAS